VRDIQATYSGDKKVRAEATDLASNIPGAKVVALMWASSVPKHYSLILCIQAIFSRGAAI